jgi:hypothetical protein
MPPPLRPATPSDEDSESDAPETISLVQSKKTVRRESADVRKAEGRVREKERVRNRERDRKLKERAVGRRGGDGEVLVGGGGMEGSEEEDGGGVEARMLRAMHDAAEETSEGDGSSESGGEDGSSMDEDDAPRSNSHPNNYLPDELFRAAFSQQTTKAKPNVPESKKKVVTKHDERRKKVSKSSSSSSKPKDILIGYAYTTTSSTLLTLASTIKRSRTVRTFQSSKSQPLPPTANPSAKVNKFFDRALGLKSQKKSLSRKGWERRPGVLFC